MLWLIITILSYFLLSLVFIVDKYLLTGPIPNFRIYSFYIGILGVFILLLVPFIDFYAPEPFQILLSFSSGAAFIYGILWFFKALQLFETSRVVPAIGGILPIFTFLLIYIFSGGEETLKFLEILAFILLIFGSVLITYEKTKKVSLKSLKISIIAAFFLALSFVFAKYVYTAQPFLVGLVWIKIGGVLMALIFLLSPQLRNDLFKEKISIQKKTATIFLLSQTAGGAGNILQNWAVALAPLVYVAFINALQGIQYAFLLIFGIFLSFKFPKIIKEEISKEILFQKILAILLIGAGLILLSLK